MKFTIFYMLLYLAQATHSVEMKSANAIKTNFSENTYSASLTDDFHFNQKAPNKVLLGKKIIPPTKIQEKNISFTIPHGQFTSATAYLYVCDDKETVCETHQLMINPKAEKTSKKSADFKHLQTAIDRAKKEKKFLLLRFTAKWCPGCIRYETEVFSNKDYKKISKGFITNKIDVDLYENFELSEKFKIAGIPTLVVLDSYGNEIDRASDFQEITAFTQFLDSIRKNPTPAQEIINNLNAKLSNDVNLNFGKRLLATGNPKAAISFFEKIQPEPFELISAKIQLAHDNFEKNPTEKDMYVLALKNALKNEDQSSRSINWRTELIKLLDPKSEEVHKLISESHNIVIALLNDPQLLAASTKTDSPGEMIKYEKLAVILEYIDLLSEANAEPKQMDEAWQLAAKTGKEYNISPKNFGPAKRFLIILVNSKKFSDAYDYAQSMLKFYPENFDVKRRLLKIALSLNKYDESIALGAQILPKSEGRNEFLVAEGLAKAYIASNQKLEAKKIVEKYLAKKEISLPKMKESKKTFEELLKTL